MYSNHVITSVLEIPALFAAFATSVGMDVDTSSPDQPVVSAPSPTGAIAFRMRATVASQSHSVILEAVDAPEVTSLAYTRSPILDDVTTSPTSVSFIGDLLPEPYIATVVHYGPSVFRHLYYGNLQKLGDFTGGEVIAATCGPVAKLTGNMSYRDNLYLANAYQRHSAAANSGGVHVVHADNPEPWRYFYGPISLNPMTGFTGKEAIGGFGDDINDGYLARGRSPFSGVNVLHPVNIYATEPIVGDTSFRPLGCLAGVRMVNIQDLPVGARIDIGGEYWRCYPAISRRSETIQPKGVNNWRSFESSYWVGYAYSEGPV